MTPDDGRSELIGESPLLHARIAGLLSLLVLATGSFAGFVASRLIVPDDVGATVGRLVAAESLFRFGIAGSLVMMVAWLFYALLLHRLLRPVDASAARTMLLLVLAAVPLYMLNQANQLGVLLSARDQLHEQAAMFLELHRFGSLVASIFFGLWLFPLGFLVLRSGFLPRILGIALLVGGPGYLILFAQGLLLPGSEPTLWTNPFLVITHLAELALLLWLLVKGVNVERWDERARGAPAARP